jgi:hypothetical protein
MRTRQSGIAVFADALARVFTLLPNTDYRAAYPHRSASQRMSDAWSRTGGDMRHAVNQAARKHGIVR